MAAAGAFYEARQIEEDQLRTLGFGSRAEFEIARALGALDAEHYRVLQRIELARRAKATADQRRRRQIAAAAETARERLVVGRWILPMMGGYILTIRHKGEGYEVVFQFARGESSVDPVVRRSFRGLASYDKDDSFQTSFVVLRDGRLNVRDNQGSVDTLKPFSGHPRNGAEVDAALQRAMLVTRATQQEERCRADAYCASKPFRDQALIACEDTIEQGARYDLRWTNGWFSPKFFDTAAWHGRDGQKNGLVDFWGDKLMLQNGFGAWQNVVYVCTFDTKQERVVDVRSVPGRLPR